jgi:hypothetical protein
MRRLPPEEFLGGLTAGKAAGRGWSTAPAGATTTADAAATTAAKA